MGTPEVSAVPIRDQQIQTMKVFILLCVVAAAMAEADPYLVYSGYGGLHHGYAGYGYGYSAYPYSTYHYGKRSADAEAKPLCTGLHTPYACGFAAPYAYGLTYASPYVHYGKRSADAEAKPEADPYLVYSGLHHGLGY